MNSQPSKTPEMNQGEDFNTYLDTFDDNPVDDWAEHEERRLAKLEEARRRSTEAVKTDPAPEEVREEVLELHPQDEPMDQSPTESGKGSGTPCIWRLEEDLSNLPAKEVPQPERIAFRGRLMSCPERIEVALAFARRYNQFPRKLFVKSLCVLRKDLKPGHQGSGSDKGGKEESKSLETKPLPTPESGPKHRDLQARTSPPILAPKSKGPAKGKKAKKKKPQVSNSKPLPEAKGKVEQPRAVKTMPVAKEQAQPKQPQVAKPKPAPKVAEPPRKGPVSGPSRKGAKRKGGPVPTPKHLVPKSSKSGPPVAENPLAQMALTQLGGMQAMVADLQAKLDRAARIEVRLCTQLERANMDVRALTMFIKDNGLEAPPTYSTR